MYDHIADLLKWILVPVVILGAMALFRKVLPMKQYEGTVQEPSFEELDGRMGDEPSFEELDDRFRKMVWPFNLSMIAIGLVFAWGSHALFVWINHSLAVADTPAVFRELPDRTIWWFFPGFGALALSYEITLQLLAWRKGRREADLYSRWSNEKTAMRGGKYAGMDSRKVLRWLAVIIALPIGVATALALPMHVSIGPNGIRCCGYAFKPCKVYPYSDAKRMTVVAGFRDRDGKFSSQAGVVIDFRDGRRWSSVDMGSFQKTVDPNLVQFLQEKTHLIAGFAETEADLPPVAKQ
ncbi:MAG TPA: hypothetical protein VMU92_04610 [Acidobacteriaceae bacterium]|jgi:hypothetical protein|nr:hypothetical protein [Acidobacteriaceae bacterium]